MKGEGMDKVREALAELVAATDPRGDTPVEGWKSAWRKAREALSSQHAEPAQSLSSQMQQMCNDWGVYWRASDAHGVDLSHEQALELLRFALGVEVAIAAPQPAPSVPAVPAKRVTLSVEQSEALQRLNASIGWLVYGKNCKAGIGAADMLVIRELLGSLGAYVEIDGAAPTEPAWKAKKAAMDAIDDGEGPHVFWHLSSEEGQRAIKESLWADFVVWATENLGQGYSLACCDGSVCDPITSWCFSGYVAGRLAAAPHPAAKGGEQ